MNDGTIILGWLILAALVGALANARGRSGVKWTLYAVLLSPLLAGIALVLIPSINQQTGDLEAAIRNKRLKDELSPYITSYKPAFSASSVYEVNINGINRKFKSEIDALAFVAAERERPTSSIAQLPKL